jgi:hypothetical protein
LLYSRRSYFSEKNPGSSKKGTWYANIKHVCTPRRQIIHTSVLEIDEIPRLAIRSAIGFTPAGKQHRKVPVRRRRVRAVQLVLHVACMQIARIARNHTPSRARAAVQFGTGVHAFVKGARLLAFNVLCLTFA